MAKDPDNRARMEMINLAKKDEDFYKTLGKKERKAIDSYEGDEIKSIDNYDALTAVRGFGEAYHKGTRGLGGAYSSLNDEVGGTMAMQEQMRQNFFDNQAKGDKDDDDKEDKELNTKPKKVTFSPELAAARAYNDAYNDFSESGNMTLLRFGTQDERAAASQQFADNYKGNVKAYLKPGAKSQRGQNINPIASMQQENAAGATLAAGTSLIAKHVLNDRNEQKQSGNFGF